MSGCFTRIWIGGELPNAEFPAFRDALCKEFDWSSEDLPAGISPEDPGSPLYFSAEECYAGAFPNLEAFCRSKKLTYCRSSEAYSGDPAWLSAWEPGMSSPLEHQADDAGNIVYTREELEWLRNILESGNIGAALLEVRELLDLVPDVPPFELSD